MGVYGTGTLIKRGRIWYFSYFDNGRSRMVSSKSEKRADAVRLRERILKQKMAGALPDSKIGKTTCGELLKGLLRHAEESLRPETARIYRWVTEANLAPFFGLLKAVNVSSDLMREYRRQRGEAGASVATCNRELSLLRIAFNLGRRGSPPLVEKVPWFPMEREDNARQGFLTDEQYTRLRDALPDYLKPLFVTAYFTGVRLGELLVWRWEQVDFEQGFVTLQADETKSGRARAVPILDGDMRERLKWAHEQSNGCGVVFHREGTPIKQFRTAWRNACKAAKVPGLKFHDLRRTAVRNMRRAGVSQIVRMRISGHRTDSMERRYNIVDVEDIRTAKALMEGRGNGDVTSVPQKGVAKPR